MIRFALLTLLFALFAGGCANDRGLSARYYNDCREYYDMHGYYHKECDENMVEYKDVKELFTPEEEAKPKGNVW